MLIYNIQDIFNYWTAIINNEIIQGMKYIEKYIKVYLK
jgi:hypothetical protein